MKAPGLAVRKSVIMGKGSSSRSSLRLPVRSPEASLVPLAMEKDVVARVGPGVEGRESVLLRSGPHRRRGLYYSDS